MNKTFYTKIRKTMSAFIVATILLLSNINITACAAVTCDIPVTHYINYKSIATEGTYQDTEGLYLYPGDIVYYNFTYTNSNVVMSFGLVTPSNQFRYFNTGAGSGVAKSYLTITEEGIHKFEVRNNSSNYAVTINGYYSTGSSYPFRSPKLAKTISQKYKQSHYGLDIVETTSGAIEGYPIYSIQKGSVKIAQKSSTAGYYVVIIGDNGYTSRYLHMNDVPVVKSGNAATYTTLLGYAGNSGDSHGAHLHIDVNTVNGTSGGASGGTITYNTTIDPESLFPQISFIYQWK